MKTAGVQAINNLSMLLALLLCCVFAFATPVPAKAASVWDTVQLEKLEHAAESPFVLFASKVSSDAPEAVLQQLDKSLLPVLVQLYFQKLYPQAIHKAAPHSYPASKGDCGLHIILTKGP